MSEGRTQPAISATPVRLGLALFISLLLHLVVILDTHVQAARRHAGKKQTLQVHFKPEAARALTIPGKGESVPAPIDAAPPEPKPQLAEDPPKQVQQGTLEVPLVGVPVYYSAAEVDVRAVPLEDIPFDLPDTPLLPQVKYFIKLAIYLDEAGQVVKTEILDAAPLGYWDEEAVTKAYRSVHFHPALKNGVPVRSRVLFYGSPEPRG